MLQCAAGRRGTLPSHTLHCVAYGGCRHAGHPLPAPACVLSHPGLFFLPCAQVVAFVKGTRSQPQCGFSHKMMQILNDSRTDYEVVNVLDDFHNPGLRDAIKQYSQWPTIPQLYVSGEFVGGSDIVEEMQASGELQKVLSEAKVPAAAK